MAKSRAVSSQLTERYALALVNLAQKNKTLKKVEADIESLQNILNESEDFKYFVEASSHSTTRRIAVIDDLAKKSGLQKETANFLKVLATNGRFESLAEMLTGVKALLAKQRGEVTATVETAYALTATQQKALAKELSDMTGQKVIVDASLNKDLIGGMVVTVGSQQIDSSVSGRLERLKNAMRKRDMSNLNDNIETLNKKEA